MRTLTHLNGNKIELMNHAPTKYLKIMNHIPTYTTPGK